jgi:hypothetical protein
MLLPLLLLSISSSSSSYTLPARFLVPKQQFNPGTKTAPPDARKVAAPQGLCRMWPPQQTRDKDNSSKWLLKDRYQYHYVVFIIYCLLLYLLSIIIEQVVLLFSGWSGGRRGIGTQQIRAQGC